METEPIVIAIVEDDADLREAFSRIFRSNPEFILAGAFPDAESFITECDILNPEVVLMDIHLPILSGIETVSLLKPKHPGMHFIMCTIYEDEENLFNSLKAGASGYILKRSTPAEIISAVYEVRAGGSPMSMSIARKVVASFYQPPKLDATYEALTAREQEILDLLAKGYRYKEISSLLKISIETVRTHIRNIYEKLQVNSRMEAINKVKRST